MRRGDKLGEAEAVRVVMRPLLAALQYIHHRVRGRPHWPCCMLRLQLQLQRTASRARRASRTAPPALEPWAAVPQACCFRALL